MDKLSVIQYLEKQVSKIEAKDFNFFVWRDATANFLDNVFGNGNEFSQQIRNLEYEEKMSYEELYPKKVVDMTSSLLKFKAVLKELIDQLIPLSEEEFNIPGTKESKTLGVVLHSLKYHLTGSQLKELSNTSTKSVEEEQLENILALVKTYDVDVIQTILAEILISKEIWQHLDL